MTNAIIYCRFSPRPDADTSKSNQQQEVRCRAYCERQGHKVVSVLCDHAKTGRVLYRPGLANALQFLKSGMVLVCDTADRLARDQLVFLTIRAQLDRMGVALEFADGSPTHLTPEGELMQNILAAFAAYERARFARRTKAGLAKKKANGEWLGRVPIGYQYDKASKQLVPRIVEQEAIQHIKLMSMAGHNSETIALWLTRNHSSCRGKIWSARTVRKILARKGK